jgi:glycosyltransferase involved in cell wall biosynthesis
MQDGELISVVIPAFDRERTIGRAIAGVLAQSYPNLEVVVVDDASRDGTAARVEALVEALGQPKLRLVRHERNRGAAAARNTGVAHARGRLVAFQDSDDDWLVEKLARQAAHLAGLGPGYVATFCTKIDYGCDQDRRYGRRLASVMPDPRETVESGDLRRRLLRGNIIGPQTVLIRKAAFEAAGGFDERLRNNEDWDFFIRLAEQGPIGFLDDPLVVVLISEDGISRRHRASAASFVRVYGKIRRKPLADRETLAALAAATASKLRNVGRPRAARRYLRRALALRPLAPGLYARYLRTYVARAPQPRGF